MSVNRCTVPKPAPPINLQDGDRWMHIHNRFLSETSEKEPDVLFLGDSVTSQLEQRCIWADIFMPMHALNFSVVGDGTQNILWRIQHGELENMTPKAIVIYAGGNNVPSSPPNDIVEGIVAIVRTVHEKQPQAVILVQQLLPRGLNPNPLREKINQVNKMLPSALHGISKCKVVPVGNNIMKCDESISHKDLYDWFYPTNEGFVKAFGPLINELAVILKVKDN